jgi:hypothetical protein
MAQMASPNEKLSFPPRRDAVSGHWAPIYIEPMVGSGERLTIGVAVTSSSGVLVVPVLGLTRMKCVYGDENDALIYAASTALDGLRQSLSAAGEDGLRRWRSPFEGILMGEIRRGAGQSMEDIARTGMMLCSSLVEKLSELDETELPHEAISEGRLEKLVRDQVIRNKPALVEAFGRNFRAQQNARAARINFVGQRIAANFSLLVPTHLAKQVKDAKSKLWDLGQVQDYVNDEQFGLSNTINQFELLIHRVRDEDPQFSEKQIISVQEAVNELEVEADKKQIICRPLYSPEEIAQRILRAEAA